MSVYLVFHSKEKMMVLCPLLCTVPLCVCVSCFVYLCASARVDVSLFASVSRMYF